MTKSLLPLALSAAVLLSSCMPTIQTAQGPAQVGFVTGTPYALVQKTPLAQITDQTPSGSYVTFPDCQGSAIRLSDVRQYGPEVAARACRESIQRGVDVQAAILPIQLVVGVPAAIVSSYFIYKLFSCLFGCN
jgi:hypothetical protein